MTAPKRKLFHIFWHICDQRPPASLARSSIGWDKKQDSLVALLVVEETSNFPTLTHTHCHEEPRNSIHLIFIVVRPTSSRQIHTQEISFVLIIIAYLMWGRPGKIKRCPKIYWKWFPWHLWRPSKLANLRPLSCTHIFGNISRPNKMFKIYGFSLEKWDRNDVWHLLRWKGESARDHELRGLSLQFRPHFPLFVSSERRKVMAAWSASDGKTGALVTSLALVLCSC